VENQHKNLLTKGAIGRALHYAVNQLPLIDPFFEDSKIQLDNNAMENKIRPLALGRIFRVKVGSSSLLVKFHIWLLIRKIEMTKNWDSY
jgi:hypothetical protein